MGFIKSLGEESGALKVVLFGSRARGDAEENSDYDIMFYGVGNEESKTQIMYKAEWEAPTLCKIDIIFAETSDDSILQSADKEGIIIYESTKNCKP